MTSNRSLFFALLLLLPLLLTAASLLPAQPPAPAAQPVDLQPQKQTVIDLRNVGTAMFSWLADLVKNEPARFVSEAKSKTEKEPLPTPASAPFAEVPVISREELAKVLVPRYIAAIPEKDGWGNPYEYRLNVKNPAAQHVMALRSPGQDGKFSAETYEIGGYSHDEVTQDLAWMDGYFVRWPEKPAQ